VKPPLKLVDAHGKRIAVRRTLSQTARWRLEVRFSARRRRADSGAVTSPSGGT
jgi:hypothetical protein